MIRNYFPYLTINIVVPLYRGIQYYYKLTLSRIYMFHPRIFLLIFCMANVILSAYDIGLGNDNVVFLVDEYLPNIYNPYVFLFLMFLSGLLFSVDLKPFEYIIGLVIPTIYSVLFFILAYNGHSISNYQSGIFVVTLVGVFISSIGIMQRLNNAIELANRNRVALEELRIQIGNVHHRSD